VLNKTGPWVYLFVLKLMAAGDFAGMIEYHKARAGCSLVHCPDISFFRHKALQDNYREYSLNTSYSCQCQFASMKIFDNLSLYGYIYCVLKI
jgi:hypothetical protein